MSQGSNDDSSNEDTSYEALKSRAMRLENEISELQKENEQLKSDVRNLKEENSNLKRPPKFVGTVEEIIDKQDEIIIKKEGDNQVFLTDYPDSVSLSAGDRVVLNDAISIIRPIETSDTDSRTQAMEVDRKPSVSFSDIGGLDDKIREIREATKKPITSPELFDNVGIDPPSGVLLYGPPGTGKTMLAKAVANEADATFLKLAGSELAQKFIGEGSRLVRDLFEVAEENSPAIIFIDEIDAIATKRTNAKSDGGAEVQRTLMQLLSEMDGFENNGDIRIMGATNRFDMLDEAILRPGRFDRIIEVPKPNEIAREEIFKIQTREMNIKSDVNFSEIATETEGLTGADIKAVCTEAGMIAIRDEREEVLSNDFHKAIEKVKSDNKNPVITKGFQ